MQAVRMVLERNGLQNRTGMWLLPLVPRGGAQGAEEIKGGRNANGCPHTCKATWENNRSNSDFEAQPANFVNLALVFCHTLRVTQKKRP